jgi:hypothetical protein
VRHITDTFEHVRSTSPSRHDSNAEASASRVFIEELDLLGDVEKPDVGAASSNEKVPAEPVSMPGILDHDAFDLDEIAESEFSDDSLGSSTLIGSYQSSARASAALGALTNFFANDEKLKLLFFAASEKSILDLNHFSNALRSLLKTFARGLMAETEERLAPDKHEIGRFVLKNARQLSHNISTVYFRTHDASKKAKQLDMLQSQSKEAGRRKILNDFLEARPKAQRPEVSASKELEGVPVSNVVRLLLGLG